MEKFEKKNHHYVPQYWQRGFKGSDGYLYGKFGSIIRRVSPKRIMQRDWLYTVFDDQWNPSDTLEDTLSTVEAKHAQLFRQLHTPGYMPTPGDRDQICQALALQASRHPDVLARSHKLSKEFGAFLADAHSMSLDEFTCRASTFGIHDTDAHTFYTVLAQKTEEQLASELADLHALSPQSPELPEQEALLAAPQIADVIKTLELCLLDAPSGEAFVLGDTPLPQSNLGLGFSVPLSKSLAVCATQAQSTITPTTVARRIANTAEVRAINGVQADNAAQVVVGPSVDLLSKL
ncbi:DUF4238 domain-containing protein [Serratia marcescens]|uniref:DUF4238 domain-containing protein n=1 Tax=Serratia TaxID=613 RepID=UPI0039BFF260